MNILKKWHFLPAKEVHKEWPKFVLGTKADYAEYLQKRNKIEVCLFWKKVGEMRGEKRKGAINGSAQIWQVLEKPNKQSDVFLNFSWSKLLAKPSEAPSGGIVILLSLVCKTSCQTLKKL